MLSEKGREGRQWIEGRRGGLAMTVILQNLFLSWLLTVLIESITAYVLGIRGKKNYILLFLVNTATNPAVVLLYLFLYSFTPLSELASQVCVELLVFAAEGLLFRASMDARRDSVPESVEAVSCSEPRILGNRSAPFTAVVDMKTAAAS